jgi:hypothetical protein
LIHVRRFLKWLRVFVLIEEVDHTAIWSFVFRNQTPLKKMVDNTLDKGWDRFHCKDGL